MSIRPPAHDYPTPIRGNANALMGQYSSYPLKCYPAQMTLSLTWSLIIQNSFLV